MAARVRVALAQMAPKLGDLNANLGQVVSWAARARRAKAGLCLFPELALSGYFVKDLVHDTALARGHRAVRALEAASRGIDLAVGGVWEDDQHRFYNALMLFTRGRLAGVHRKAYPPTYGLFDERRYFGFGEGPTVAEGRLGRCGLLVCEDSWHAVMPLGTALLGAQMLLVASSSPVRGLLQSQAREGASGVTQTWQALNLSQASTLGLPLLFCNRVGSEEGITFWGGSEVLAADGSVLARAPYFEEHLLLADLDPADVRRARSASPLLRDERLDMDTRVFAGLAGWALAPQPSHGRPSRSKA